MPRTSQEVLKEVLSHHRKCCVCVCYCLALLPPAPLYLSISLPLYSLKCRRCAGRTCPPESSRGEREQAGPAARCDSLLALLGPTPGDAGDEGSNNAGWSPDPVDAAECEEGYGRILSRMGRLHEAEALYARAIDRLEQNAEDGHNGHYRGALRSSSSSSSSSSLPSSSSRALADIKLDRAVLLRRGAQGPECRGLVRGLAEDHLDRWASPARANGTSRPPASTTATSNTERTVELLLSAANLSVEAGAPPSAAVRCLQEAARALIESSAISSSTTGSSSSSSKAMMRRGVALLEQALQILETTLAAEDVQARQAWPYRHAPRLGASRLARAGVQAQLALALCKAEPQHKTAATERRARQLARASASTTRDLNAVNRRRDADPRWLQYGIHPDDILLATGDEAAAAANACGHVMMGQRRFGEAGRRFDDAVRLAAPGSYEKERALADRAAAWAGTPAAMCW